MKKKLKKNKKKINTLYFWAGEENYQNSMEYSHSQSITYIRSIIHLLQEL